MTNEKFSDGLSLSQKLDHSFLQKYNFDKVNAYSDMYDDAVQLMKSHDLQAFDLKEETASTRDAYGEDNFGQGADISRKKGGGTVNVLTHCNAGWLACIEYGTATAPIYEAFEKDIDLHVWVDETRPLNQGSRLTAWELVARVIARERAAPTLST